MIRLILISTLLALVGCLAPAAWAGSPGSLDADFDSSGMVHLGFGFAHDEGQDMVVQSDGKIVVAGLAYNGERREVVVARYNTDGSLDPTFSRDGKAITSVRYSEDPAQVAEDLGLAVALQSDGRIVVAGYTRAGASGVDVLVLRYNTDGRLDVNFGANGSVITDIAGQGDVASDVAIQADGKIVVVGSATIADDTKFAIVRYDTNGAPDPSFGSGGIVTLGNQFVDIAYGVAIQNDGKLVVTGYTESINGFQDIAVLRLDTSGSPDLTFDGDGWVYTNTSLTESGYAVDIQFDPPSTEKIVVAGLSSTSSIVLRYLPSGAPDPSFDGDGRTFVADAQARDVEVVTSAGNPTHILACGSANVAGQARFFTARYLLNGTPDAALDGDGILITQIGNSAGAGAVHVASGKLIVAGSSGANFDADITVARYSDTGLLDATFDGDGIRSDPFGNSRANARAVAHASDDKIVIAGNVSEANSSRQRIGVMRLLTNGTLDPTFGGRGTVTTDVAAGDDIVGGVVVQSDGKIVVAGTSITPDNSNSDIAVLRYLSDGQLDPSFSGDGIQVFNLAQLDRAQAVALQPDGKIVVAGWTSNLSDTDIALLRFDSNGLLDATFNFDGMAIMDISPVDDRALALTLQSDGKIVIAGEFWVGDLATGHIEAFVARLEGDGDPDLPFGGDGTAVADPPIGGLPNDGAASVAVQLDGKIVMGGWRDVIDDTQMAIVRFLSNGAMDAGFDGDGVRYATVGSGGNRANGVAVLPYGYMIAVGPGFDFGPRRDFAIAALRSDGTFSDEILPSGRTPYDFVLGSEDQCSAVSLDSQARIVLVGPASGVFGVLRLNGMAVLVDAPVAVAPSRSRVWIAGANPFSGSATVAFEMDQAGPIRLDLYDVKGAHVRTLATGDWPAGSHRLDWDGADSRARTMSAGMYYVRLTRGQASSTAKMMKIR